MCIRDRNTYGFEADLTNDKSLSFDEDGAYKFDRDHPFIKDIYEKGKFGRGKSEGKGDKEDREGGEKDDEDKEKGEVLIGEEEMKDVLSLLCLILL